MRSNSAAESILHTPTLTADDGIAQTPARIPRFGFIECFIIGQVLLPALLYLPGTQALRVPIRIAPFAMSLLPVMWAIQKRRRKRNHIARPVLILILAYLTVQIFSPTTNTTMAGCAQVMLYLSVMAPLFWVPELVNSTKQLERAMVIMLVCNGINSSVGILQVYDPDRWMPRELTTIYADVGYATYVHDDGRVLPRPTGLSDNPGAVCGPATNAALLGLIYLLRPIAPWKRLAAGAASFTGVAAIYLSNVRTSLLILFGMMLIYTLLLLIQRQHVRSLWFFVLSVGLAVGGFFFASGLAGRSVTDRFATLVEDDPVTVYYNASRGRMMQYDLPYFLSEYPLGAGLGRWGMMRRYFGDENNANSPSIWAELQMPAWALDGGWILVVGYSAVLVLVAVSEYRLCQRSDRSISSWAAIILAANSGTLALVFGFAPFTTQVGLQYWFQVGALHGAANPTRQRQE